MHVNLDIGEDSNVSLEVLNSFAPSVPLPTGEAVEGQPVIMYGNSYIGQDNMNTVGARWPDRVKQRLGLGALTNRHLGGASIWDIGTKMIGTVGGTTLAAGTTGIIMIGGALIGEQLVAADGANPLHYATVKDGMRALLATASAWIRGESASYSATGTWSTSTATNYSGGSYRYSTSQGDTLTYTVGAGLGGKFDLLIPALDPAAFGRRSMIVKVNDNIVKDVSPQSSGLLDATFGYFTTSIDVVDGDVIKFEVGPQTVAGPGPLTAGLDAVLIRSPTPPLIVVTHEPDIGLGSVTNYALLRQAVEEACDEFSNALLVDVADGFSRSTMIGSDGLHMNDRGQAHYAAAVTEAMAGVEMRSGLNKLSLAP